MGVRPDLREHPHDRPTHQSAPPADDRRHDGPQVRGADAGRYVRAVKGFNAFCGASPDTAKAEDLRRYRLHLVASSGGMPTSHHSLRALRFLFLVTLRKPAIVLDMPFVREPRPLPVLLSPEEVARLLDAAPGLKYKAALSIAYGAGLRASEVATAPLAIPFGAARNAPSQATILPSNSTSFRDG